jgi:cytochrome c nitrite reductase small subunit
MGPGSDRPSGKLPFAAGLAVGVLVAAFAALGYHGSGSASFCMTCHSMKEAGARWQQSNHKQFACIDCHLPDDHFIAQVSYKARAGLNDLYHETLRSYPATLAISAEARSIVRGNCLRCHYTTIEKTPMAGGEGGDCLKCHRRLVHGRGPEKGGIHVE